MISGGDLGGSRGKVMARAANAALLAGGVMG